MPPSDRAESGFGGSAVRQVRFSWAAINGKTSQGNLTDDPMTPRPVASIVLSVGAVTLSLYVTKPTEVTSSRARLSV